MKKYELTPEHCAQLKPWADRWIANAMSTAAMTDEDRIACREAVIGMYAAAKLPPPKHIVFVPSPFVLAFAGGFSAAIWHLSKGLAATWDATRDATRDATSDATETESGHHHGFRANQGVTVMERTEHVPAGMKIMYAILENPTALIQDAPAPHDPLMLDAGTYEIRISREYNPFAEQARKVAD